MLKCRDMTELSTAYMEGALDWRGRLAVVWHLAICSRCRAYYDQVSKMVRMLHGRLMSAPDPATEARLLEASRPGPEGRAP